MYKVSVYEVGAPENMRFEAMELRRPVGREVLIRHTAIGVNFIDIYHCQGLYSAGDLPFSLGVEAVGVIEAIGDEVMFYEVGDRVGYVKGGLGSYATHRLIQEENLVMLPPEISDVQAASSLLKGLTAHYLLRRTFVVDNSITMLVQAAAGGVGLFLSQWARYLGAKVIGTVGSTEKARLAHANGCNEVILYREENVSERVRVLTAGNGCNIVYDGVGKDTFFSSLDCLMPYGLMVSYGQSSGAIPPFDILELSRRGSLYLTRPTLFDYKKDFQEYTQSAEEFFGLMINGIIKEHIYAQYPLSSVVEAHRDLLSRKTHGALVLIP